MSKPFRHLVMTFGLIAAALGTGHAYCPEGTVDGGAYGHGASGATVTFDPINAATIHAEFMEGLMKIARAQALSNCDRSIDEMPHDTIVFETCEVYSEVPTSEPTDGPILTVLLSASAHARGKACVRAN